MRIGERAGQFRLGRDALFWLIIGAVVLVYALLRLNPLLFVTGLVGLILAITVHECAHAWAADQLGDPTARYQGRVSLNPLVHLDPLGSAMMVITTLTGMGIGWGKPVPVSGYRLRYGERLGGGIVALAGPLSNLALAAVLGLSLRVLTPRLTPTWGMLVGVVVWTNIVIAMFNLLPVPPLDGHSVLLGLLSLSHARWAWQVSSFIVRVQQQGPFALLVLIIVSQFLGINILGWLIGPPSRFFYQLVVGSGA
jgi:Zn-dependent protease